MQDEKKQPLPKVSPPRGHLNVFLGYAPGVGKTHAMLEAAHQRLAEGLEVVAACVNTHDQPELEALLDGIEFLTSKVEQVQRTPEIDLDAILVRHPQLVLIDDLAHTNPPDSRHPRRYQDVEELLDQGIDVFTTLNIHHLESLQDSIEQITGLKAWETIPDRLLDASVDIQLVDLPPGELMHRLREGKVHIPEPMVFNAKSFFRLGNLTALRQMALRQTAIHADDQMRGYMVARDIPGPWPAGERLMVCISSHPLNLRLVRTGRRLSSELGAEWFVVYVETPERLSYSAAHSERVADALRLAEELGAEVHTITGQDIPEAVIDFAQKHNITQIIVGNPLRPRWQGPFSSSITDEIIRRSGSIDVFVVSDESGPIQRNLWQVFRPRSPLGSYLWGVVFVIAVTLLSWPLHTYFHPANLVMPYLATVVVAAIFLGRGPSILASFLSVLAFDFFYVDPRFDFGVNDTEYLLTFLGLLVVGLVISNLAGQVRDQVGVLRRRESQTSTLYALSRELTVSGDLDAVLNKVIDQIAKTFSRETVILLPEGEQLKIRAASLDFSLDKSEIAIAEWSFENNQPAGHGTDTSSNVRIRYQPLRTVHGVVGVLGVKPADPNQYLTLEQRQLLDAYASLAALAIERARLAEQADQARMVEVSEKLQSALLNSISHDLRTPLVTITGVLSSLSEEYAGRTLPMDPKTRQELVQAGLEEADRMNRLVANLLDMSRLEAGVLRLNRQSSDVEEIIGSALHRMAKKLEGHAIETSIPEDMPLVLVDFILVEQVLINLLDNASKYSGAGSPIEIAAKVLADEIQVTIRDRGPGIPEEDLERIFDKFFRVQQPGHLVGTGLGLSICKGIIEAHGGRITAANRPGGGTEFTFTLPLSSEFPLVSVEGGSR